MAASESLVGRLADLAGVAARYTDVFGQTVETPSAVRAGILRHLGLPADTDVEAEASFERIAALRQGLVPALIPVEARRATRVPLRGTAVSIAWRLSDERGGVREGRAPVANGEFDLPPLTPGYHRLSVSVGGTTAEAMVIAAPQRCWRPLAYADVQVRDWGLAAQIYGLRSEENLGIGSYADVGHAAADAGALGAAFLGLSPVHALFPSDRTKISPYSPSSRLFLETLHIDPRGVPGFAGSGAARMLDGRAAQIAALRDAALVDHAGVWAVLHPVLEALWQTSPARAGLDPEFAAFREAGGALLESHATYEALAEHCRADGAHWLGEWPEALRRAGTDDVRTFAEANRERVAFHAWLQWLADRQLQAAADAGREAGMRLGLYRDLAVGADRGGAEVWSHPRRFALGLSIGAPPDLLAPQGQDWGLPPFDPVEMERDGLAAFRDLVQANMRHAGAIRIDHAFQLARLFVVPLGATGREGAYVAMPFEAMLAVLRLESHRARCLVIAEDLGTGPEGFSDAIMRAGLLSYRVLQFERGEGGAFKAPDAYPREALAAITTHDLPTFVGWWRGFDTDLRQTLTLYDGERAERERADRVVERAELAKALNAQGLLGSVEPPEAPPFEGATRYLARTPAVLTAVQYEDVLAEISQANMPGSTEGHPNWRRKLSLDLEGIAAPGGPLAKTAASLSGEGRGSRSGASRLASPPPRATYRLQFHEGFTFDDAARIAPYLSKLGISHVYASPISKARPGSTHGYDIVDHSALNPELGGEEAFLRFSDVLTQHDLKLLLDIVPNHMGVGGADNPWWLAVLEWGGLSPMADAFDIDWERLGADHKLVVPFLGDRYGDALEAGNLQLKFEPEEGAFSVWHFEHRFPVNPLGYPIVLDRALAALAEVGDDASVELVSISERLRRMSEETDAGRRKGFPAEGDDLKRRLAAVVARAPDIAHAIERALTLVNGFKGRPESFGTLHRILELQSYRMAHWRVASSDINYRRFFDVNSLAGLRVELSDIFARSHETIFRHVREGRIHGLRIDHIDGLADPAGYASLLQEALGPGFFVAVEKILEPGERLRPWPIAGTTGYDVLNQIDGLFVDKTGEAAVEALFRSATGTEGRYGALLRGCKMEILETSFASELEVLTSDLKRVADADRRTRDFSVNSLRRALVEIVARFPVYRSYLPANLDEDQVEEEDVALIEGAVAGAKRQSLLPDRSVHDFAANVLLGRVDTEGAGRPAAEVVLRTRQRFQQLTGPVMAKSLEDTLFYRYGRLLALNEVGGDPGEYGLDEAHFHGLQAARARDWPNAMICTATHDTKRGEDARTRMLALSEMPEVWAQAWEDWKRVAAPHIARTPEGDAAPDAVDQWMLMQAILGAWPLELLVGEDAGETEAFVERAEGFAEKALREAKRRSSWVNADEGYEGATKTLLGALMRPGSHFLAAFRPIARRLAFLGMIAGLSRSVLKCTLPGIPDIYQGTEFWDFSFVDPDNRRPVDYPERERALGEADDPAALFAHWTDGRVKQAVLVRLLADRAAEPVFYADADYRPLRAGSHAIAYARTQALPGGVTAERVVVAARLTAGKIEGETWSAKGWRGTPLAVGEGVWQDILTGREHRAGGAGLDLGDLFSALPVAVLRRRDA